MEIAPCELAPVDLQVEGKRFVASGWVSHNSALKGMEANAAWVPFVASPTAPYVEYVESGGGGLIAERGHDWLAALEMLTADTKLRWFLQQRGRLVAEKMTIQRHAGRWRDAYEWVREQTLAGRVSCEL